MSQFAFRNSYHIQTPICITDSQFIALLTPLQIRYRIITFPFKNRLFRFSSSQFPHSQISLNISTSKTKWRQLIIHTQTTHKIFMIRIIYAICEILFPQFYIPVQRWCQIKIVLFSIWVEKWFKIDCLKISQNRFMKVLKLLF